METHTQKLFLYLIWSYFFFFFIRLHSVSWCWRRRCSCMMKWKSECEVLPHRVKTCTKSKMARLNSVTTTTVLSNPKWRQRPCSWWGVSPPGRNSLTCDSPPCCRCHHAAPHSAEAWPTRSQGDWSSGWRAGRSATKRVVVQFPPFCPWSRHIARCKCEWLLAAGGGRGHWCRLAFAHGAPPPPPPVVVQWTFIPDFVFSILYRWRTHSSLCFKASFQTQFMVSDIQNPPGEHWITFPDHHQCNYGVNEWMNIGIIGKNINKTFEFQEITWVRHKSNPLQYKCACIISPGLRVEFPQNNLFIIFFWSRTQSLDFLQNKEHFNVRSECNVQKLQ